MKRHSAVTLVLLLLAGAARAEDIAQAKALFDAGAAAYDKHDYVGAIRAFEGAQRAAPRPPIMFSLAQAHRRQFYVDGNADHQKVAIDLFKDYVKQVPSGGRHEDAMRALQELGAFAAQKDATSISLNSSGTPNARVSLDGAPSVAVPLIGPVTPGKHHALISAEGYTSEERDVVAVDGQIVALDVPLKEKPARVTFKTLAGAVVDVDGRPMGETPFTAPLELTPGTHLFAIAKNGHTGFGREIDLARGEQREISAPLPMTTQRVLSETLLVASGVTVVAAATFAAIAATYLGQANAIYTKGQHQNITEAERTTYYDDRSWRGVWLIASGASFAGAGVLAATGLVLFVFDRPSTPKAEERKAKPEHKIEPTDLSFAPILGPTTVGASALLRF
jgi:hypothetical protein